MFNFYDSPACFADADPAAHVAMVPAGLKTERALMLAVKEGLAFPAYCGLNFDACWDCIRELEGVAARRILLAHRDVPALPEWKLAAYVELLRDAVLHWRNPGFNRRLEVWFPAAHAETIDALLRACPPPSTRE